MGAIGTSWKASGKRPLGMIKDVQKDIAESFLRLAEEPSRPIALLTRYEYALWRQARQIVFALRSFRRNRRAMRRGVLTQTPYPLYPRRRTFIT